MHEPMTVATDYLLAIFAIAFAVRLARHNAMWAAAFAFTALGAILGGTFHGFAPAMDGSMASLLWKATLVSIGLASFSLLGGSDGKPLLAVATVKFLAYVAIVVRDDDFKWVIVDYGLTLLIVGVVFALRGGVAARWMWGSIVASIAGALIQQQRLALHQHFNHNDLYHLVQIVALWLLYRAGRTSAALHFGSRSPVRAAQSSDARL
jgi:hypothetical protein